MTSLSDAAAAAVTFAAHFQRSTTTKRNVVNIKCGIRELRTRIDSVKNTQKITEAMKLVAAARVRRAQEAVINSRPFAHALVQVLFELNQQLLFDDDIQTPLTQVRPVQTVALVVVTGDRGLCGGFNNAVIKMAEARILELQKLGVSATVVSVGKKGNSYFRRREDRVNVDHFIDGANMPTAKEAQAIADDVFSMFLSQDVDKVELLYTKFVSLVKSEPVIHTLLPLSSKGQVIDLSGNCVDAVDDEYFRLTTKGGKLNVERDVVAAERPKFLPNMQFEQDPVQIIDALMPLYLNSQILKALQESLASELAARMGAMSNATDNANDLKKSLTMAYNRERQAKITSEILEIVAGAEALRYLSVPMGDVYRSVSKKSLRGYGGLSISLADQDFQEDEVWDTYGGHAEDYFPPKGDYFSAAPPKNSSTHQKTSQSSLSRMFGRDKNKSYAAKEARHSVPVSIPDWSKICGHGNSSTHYIKASDEESENSDVGEVYELPPHEWLQRKHSRRQMSSFSVVEGAGRTLKGRDLSKVRDSVLTRTGFLE